MKKITVLLILLLLTGCVNKPIDVTSDLDTLLANLDYKYIVRENTSTDFFNYYLPSDMVNEDGDGISAAVKYNENKIVINLNISAVVNSYSFGVDKFNNDGFFKDDMLVYQKADNFSMYDESSSKYLLKIYNDGNSNLVNLITNELNFYGVCDDYDLVQVVRHMFIIAKSAEVNYEKVNLKYSNKDIIEYVKQPVNLFEYDIPVSGFLSDLVHQSNGTIVNGDGEIPIDSDYQEQIEEIEDETEEEELED